MCVLYEGGDYGLGSILLKLLTGNAHAVFISLITIVSRSLVMRLLETLNCAITTNNIQSTFIKLIIMETLQYKIIRTDTQYNKYCDALEALVGGGKKTKAVQDEIELLNLLIEKYDEEHNTFDDANPIELLKSLVKEHTIKAVELAKLLHVSEGLVSDMLNYKKGLSKETICILSARFKLNQEAFNRAYELQVPVSSGFKKTSRMMNSRKNLKTA